MPAGSPETRPCRDLWSRKLPSQDFHAVALSNCPVPVHLVATMTPGWLGCGGRRIGTDCVSESLSCLFLLSATLSLLDLLLSPSVFLFQSQYPLPFWLDKIRSVYYWNHSVCCLWLLIVFCRHSSRPLQLCVLCSWSPGEDFLSLCSACQCHLSSRKKLVLSEQYWKLRVFYCHNLDGDLLLRWLPGRCWQSVGAITPSS